MEYYHGLITEKSFKFLQQLKKTTSVKELRLNEQKLAKLKKKIYGQV